ncbi:MAG: hypothetical protein JEY96_19500 [Bacteroidales bacterium]|nr:hypothetical protein [Bacteroidales bacterium]
MRKTIAIISSITFAICLFGILLIDDSDFESIGLYIVITISGIISLITLTILIVNSKTDGLKLFSKFLGRISYLVLIILVLFSIGLSIYKIKSGYKTKREIMIENYNKIITNDFGKVETLNDSLMISDTLKE